VYPRVCHNVSAKPLALSLPHSLFHFSLSFPFNLTIINTKRMTTETQAKDFLKEEQETFHIYSDDSDDDYSFHDVLDEKDQGKTNLTKKPFPQ
jgi:hypothetical protein